MIFQAISKFITVLKLSDFSSIEDLQKYLSFKAKAIQISTSSNPLKTIDYLKPSEISLKTFRNPIDTHLKLYIIRTSLRRTGSS